MRPDLVDVGRENEVSLVMTVSNFLFFFHSKWKCVEWVASRPPEKEDLDTDDVHPVLTLVVFDVAQSNCLFSLTRSF